MSEIDPAVAKLKERMLQKSYYAMFRTVQEPAKIGPVMLEHYQWIIGLEKDNLILASGPLFKNDGSQGVGLTIFRCESFEEAETLAQNDPFVVCGAVGYEVQRWQVNEGRINVAIDFSDQTYSFS